MRFQFCKLWEKRCFTIFFTLIASIIFTISLSIAGGFDFIDSRVNKDDNGIWQYHYDLPVYLIGATLAGAIWEGNDTRLGKTLWKSTDALIISGGVTQALKYSTTRVRPSDTDDPNLWFKGGSNHSFPSGHVSSVAALVTPIIIEYKDDSPWVYLLASIPLYEAVGRVKAQAHWQTDVLAGVAIGVAAGYYEQKFKSPLIFYILPEGFYVGLQYWF